MSPKAPLNLFWVCHSLLGENVGKRDTHQLITDGHTKLYTHYEKPYCNSLRSWEHIYFKIQLY